MLDSAAPESPTPDASTPSPPASLRRARRWWVAVGAGVVLLAVAGLWLDRARSAPGRWSDGLPVGEAAAIGVAAPVEVLWDSVGVPQLWATDEGDLLFAQGWLHAHHRLWQMELFRRVAQGRLSELFGDPTLETDRFLRTLGLDRAARQTADALDDETRAMVQRYVDGVNERVRSLPRLPPEMRLLGLTPEPWSLADVTAIEKILAWDLSAYEATIDNAATWATLGHERWQDFRPRYPRWAPTILADEPPAEPMLVAQGAISTAVDPVPASTPPATRPLHAASSPASAAPAPDRAEELPRLPELANPARAELFASARLPQSSRRWVEGRSLVRASNSWVVGPSRSASGAPLLANDPHLALDHPNIWYVLGLHAPGIDIVGTSVPGMPGIVLGHTPGVAWGFTNASLDDMDLFIERVDPADSTRYQVPGGSEPFTRHVEVIEVRGRDVADTLIVRETRHGPVLTPVVSRLGGELVSLRWVAHDVSHAQRALRGLMRVRSAPELLEVLEDLDVAHQNVVFADTAGAWGYWMAGRIPRRPGGRAQLLPVPGWTGEGDWQGYLSFADHPHQIAPERGYIATANHRQSWSEVSYAVSDEVWAAPFRAIRIIERLEQTDSATADDMAELQTDVVSAFALRYRAAASQAFRGAGLDSVAEALAQWDGGHLVSDRTAPVFHAWFRKVHEALRAGRWPDGAGYFPSTLAARWLDEGRVDEAVARQAALEAWAEVGGLEWGEVHRLTLDHPLAAVPLLRRLGGFGRLDLPQRGGPHTVDVAGMEGGSPPWTVRWGASHRHVVDLADPDATGTFVIPGGSSGWPGDRLTMNLLGPWQRGERVSVPLSRSRIEARTMARLVLRPEG
jgi:penicillin amidase